jgi:spore maturation protein CgeB
MRVIVIGDGKNFSSANSCAREFRAQGCEVLHFDNRKPLNIFAGLSWDRLGRPGRLVYEYIRSRQFVAEAISFRPDLIFTQKAENISARAIAEVKQATGARFSMWYADSPFHEGVTSMHVLRQLPLCDIHYTWGRFLIEPLKASGCPRVEYMPFAYDPWMHPPDTEPSAEERRNFSSDICFVGSWDPEREKFLEVFDGHNLSIYGQRWRSCADRSGKVWPYIRGDTLWGAELVKAFKSARVVLNMLRGFNHTSHNFRTMEATGIGGGVLLTPWTPEQVDFFTPGTDILTYRTPAEAREILESVLDGRTDISGMSMRAREIVNREHLLSHRIARIIDDAQMLR